MRENEKKSEKNEAKSHRKPYKKPVIESTNVFETFTLQSCNLTPDDGCIGLFE